MGRVGWRAVLRLELHTTASQHLSGLQTGWAGLMRKDARVTTVNFVCRSRSMFPLNCRGLGLSLLWKHPIKRPETVSNYFLFPSLNHFSVEEPCCSFPMDFPHVSRPWVLQGCWALPSDAAQRSPAQQHPRTGRIGVGGSRGGRKVFALLPLHSQFLTQFCCL